jgi:transporter family protein
VNYQCRVCKNASCFDWSALSYKRQCDKSCSKIGQYVARLELIGNIQNMAPWFWYAVVAAVLYGAHQIFTRLASDHIGDGLGGFVVEATAALSILLYLGGLWLTSRWNQKFSAAGFGYSVLTGVCVGAGTIAFFLLFQKGGPLSSVPAILAGGAAIMAIAGILFFEEPASLPRLAGVILALAGLFLLRS